MAKSSMSIVNDKKNEGNEIESNLFLNRKDLKDVIAPSGIDASDIDHLEIYSSTIKRYARWIYEESYWFVFNRSKDSWKWREVY